MWHVYTHIINFVLNYLDTKTSNFYFEKLKSLLKESYSFIPLKHFEIINVKFKNLNIKPKIYLSANYQIKYPLKYKFYKTKCKR